MFFKEFIFFSFGNVLLCNVKDMYPILIFKLLILERYIQL